MDTQIGPFGIEAETDVAVIGAGPYGLSVAAHLAARGVRHRVFGLPMDSWMQHMPRDMFLKSPGAGSNLSDPAHTFTLGRYCAQEGIGYSDWDTPIPIGVFNAYGLWFQRNCVADLDTRLVRNCLRSAGGFRLELEDGAEIVAGQVVVCTGHLGGAFRPEELTKLPSHLLSHTSEHRSFERFCGRQVAVVGAGQSALETAALLAEAGAYPTLVARARRIVWGEREGQPSSLAALRHPRTPIGSGWRYAFFDHPARPFSFLPPAMRKHLVDTILGPFGAWWLKPRLVGRTPALLGRTIREVGVHKGRAALTLEHDGEIAMLIVDHVIAGTGYQMSPGALPFLSPELRSEIGWNYGSPRLSRRFESEAPGLYFTGLASAQSFGPVMRFVAGARHTCGILADRLAEQSNQSRAQLAHRRPRRAASFRRNEGEVAELDAR